MDYIFLFQNLFLNPLVERKPLHRICKCNIRREVLSLLSSLTIYLIIVKNWKFIKVIEMAELLTTEGGDRGEGDWTGGGDKVQSRK